MNSIIKKLSVKRVIVIASVLMLGCAVALFLFPYFLEGNNAVVTESVTDDTVENPSKSVNRELSVVTLNLAHGRRDAASRLFISEDAARKNLDEVAKMLKDEAPHIAALQEADGPSVWSGNFNHLIYLSKHSNFTGFIRGEHVKGLGLSYGAAIVSRIELHDAESITFEPSPPSFSKGFVKCTINWPGIENVKVDLVSLHLDFLNNSVRTSQVKVIADHLVGVKRPVIVMGDFNSDWKSPDSPVKLLARKLNLSAHQPESKGMATFKFTNKRLDWILISKELEFVEYKILPHNLSDHYGLQAKIRFIE